MRSLFSYFWVVFILTGSLCQEQEAQKPKELEELDFSEYPGERVESFKDFEKFSNSSDQTFFLYFYHQESSNSKKIINLIKNIEKRLKGYILFYSYDCTGNKEGLSYCAKAAGTDGFPRMMAFEPPQHRVNPYTRKPNYHTQYTYSDRNINELLIYNFITKHIISHAIKLNVDNIEDFLNQDNINKVILFTDKENTPLMFRALSNAVFDKVLVGVVHHTEKRIIRRFGISKMPVVINYITVDKDFIPYQDALIEAFSDEPTFSKLLQFVERHALNEKRWILRNQGKPLWQRRIYRNCTLEEFPEIANQYKMRRIIVRISENSTVPLETVNLFSNLNGFFVFVNIDCKLTLLDCMNTFKLTDFSTWVMLNEGDNHTERMKNLTTLGSTPSDIHFDFLSLYQGSQLKESRNETVAQMSYAARKEGKYPIFYLYNDVFSWVKLDLPKSGSLSTCK